MGINCPKCQSEQVQAISVIVQSGTTNTTGIVTGAAVGTGGSGIFSGTSNNTSQTALAARFNPPKKPVFWILIPFGLFALISSPWLLASGDDVGFRIASLIIWANFGFMVRYYRKTAANYKEKFPVWQEWMQKGFYCTRCGNTYLVN